MRTQSATFAHLRTKPYRVQLTVGGDRVDYPHDPAAPAASLIESKLIFNSTISTPGTRFFLADIKDYFLNNPMEEYKYMHIPYQWFRQELRDQYNLDDIVTDDGYIYCEICKGMYGLKQAARLAYGRLVKNLAPHGYFHSGTILACGSMQLYQRSLLFVLMTSGSNICTGIMLITWSMH